MKVVFTKSARLDLLSIGDWIAEQDGDFARSYIGKLSEAALSLAEMPGKGVARSQWGAGVRVWFVDRYVIAYRIKDDVVEIVCIVHGARDLDRLFESSEY